MFLDEPTLGLDPAGQRQVLSTVRQIAGERGATVLLSTHLLAEVEENVLARAHPQPRPCGCAGHGRRGRRARRGASERRLHVPEEHVETAVAALRAVGGGDGRTANGRPGLLEVTLAQTDGRPPEETMNAGVRAIVDARIPLLSFELEGARLSDAFLAMTEVP